MLKKSWFLTFHKMNILGQIWNSAKGDALQDNYYCDTKSIFEKHFFPTFKACTEYNLKVHSK